MAVQHAMLVGFLALLCPDKEVHKKRCARIPPRQTTIYKLLFQFTYSYKLVFFFSQLVDDEADGGDGLLAGCGVLDRKSVV